MEALIGLLGVVVGILLGKGLERLLDLRRRRDREIDMVFALHAEISAGRSAARDQNAPEEAAYLVENEFPAGPSDRTDFVFETLKPDLSVLPQQVIHQIVLYYRLAEQSNLMVDFLTTQSYERQSTDERKRFRQNIMAGLRDQEAAAERALASLETFIARCGLAIPVRSRVRSDERSDRSDHESIPPKTSPPTYR